MKNLLKDPEQQKMYEHIIGMFIVTWLLLIALFVAGCKDKAEADDDMQLIYTDDIIYGVQEPNEPEEKTLTCNNPDCDRVFSKMGELLLHCCVVTGLNEPLANWYDRGTFVITTESEPNEPKPDTSRLVGGFKKIAELIEYYHKEPKE